MKSIKNYLTPFILFSAILLLGLGSCGPVATENNESKSTETTTQPKIVKQGEVLKTDYFLVTVNSVGTSKGVSTGNEFADLPPKPGNQYLIINVTFKNIDKESRMAMEGSVFITYNGSDYEYDKSETIMAEGWGLLMAQINPLTSLTTNLVYMIPDEIKGPAYWNPGRADSDEKIFLGTLK